ncbi:jg12927 [Pararge aegeria aegeria]|uniref:Jg12927 protein n=1 Tax=Pararge aegeria aegeria TaxID=348720 RepID=A0A8S4SNK9_9NEOP|nr:jg12927 [Pararge aegeria aegeria]
MATSHRLTQRLYPRRGGQMTLNVPHGAAGTKRHKTVEFGTPTKKPLYTSGRQSVDMIMNCRTKLSEKPSPIIGATLRRVCKEHVLHIAALFTSN